MIKSIFLLSYKLARHILPNVREHVFLSVISKIKDLICFLTLCLFTTHAAVCWMPFFCVNIVAAFCKTCIGETTFKILSWLGYSNSAFNPIIYSIFNTEFRKAFKRILLKRQWPRLLCCGSFHNDYYVNTSNDSKFVTNYDGRCLHSTTDVEQLSAI